MLRPPPPRPARWQYYGGRRNPLDTSTPARTVEASGISVRLFDAALADGSRALLKEYLGEEARAIGQRELDIYEHLDAGGGFAKLDVGACSVHTPPSRFSADKEDPSGMGQGRLGSPASTPRFPVAPLPRGLLLSLPTPCSSPPWEAGGLAITRSLAPPSPADVLLPPPLVC